MLFAKALKGQNVTELLSNIGTAAPAGDGQAAPVQDDKVAEAEAPKKEEVEVVEMTGLFDDDEYWDKPNIQINSTYCLNL